MKVTQYGYWLYLAALENAFYVHSHNFWFALLTVQYYTVNENRIQQVVVETTFIHEVLDGHRVGVCFIYFKIMCTMDT